jgi:hypothetical protein
MFNQINQTYKITKTISTISGTLYKDELVKFVQKENGHYRVKDSTGKLWFVEREYLKEFRI